MANMNLEKTTQELIFELGNGARSLTLHKYLGLNINSVPFGLVEEKFDRFKAKALILGVSLPDLTEDTLTEEFLASQIGKVFDYIRLHKTGSMAQLFRTGTAVEQFFTVLGLIEGEAGETSSVNAQQKLTFMANESLGAILEFAKPLDVGIGAQLKEELTAIRDNYLNSQFDQRSREELRLKLKMKLCGLVNQTPSVDKRSEVDPSRVITDDSWAVSLVRLPDRDRSEHVFIVLEGKQGRKSKIWFADFIAGRGMFDVVNPGTKEGKVRIDYHESEDPTSSLLFECEKEMMNVRANDRWLHTTMLIPKATAEILIENIEKSKKEPPKFHLAGDKSVVAIGSATSSSNTTGHNCFTWAKKMLDDLNDINIKLPEEGYDTWIYAASSNYLVDKRFGSSKFGFLLMFAIGVAVSFLLYKASLPAK
ncbi:uncharacterized protein [Acropora muricata]|uniref:uncharacterized protein n=1 Tax=Acropora muricata TaxID=159855 RepID=UPI0034E5E553